MEIIYSDEALKDIEYWKKSGNKAYKERSNNSLMQLQKIHSKALANPNH